MLMKFMLMILVSQGGSQSKSSSVRSFDLMRPGVVPQWLNMAWSTLPSGVRGRGRTPPRPQTHVCAFTTQNASRDSIFSNISGGRGGWTLNP